MAQEQANIKPKRKISYKLLIALIGALIMIIIVGLIYFQYMFFKSKAEGIAIGYSSAAAAAYQMGRQIPDRIFEVESYRVEIITGGQPLGITVNVRDRYSNVTHYSYTQPVTIQAGTPIVNPR